MNQRYIRLIIILAIIGFCVWLALPNQGFNFSGFVRLNPVLGLDLRGGTQALLEVDLPADTPVAAESMNDARGILESRINGLGVNESTIQIAGARRIVVEVPGMSDPKAMIGVIKETGLLEFVNLGATYLEPGTAVVTDHKVGSGTATTPSATTAPTLAPTAAPGTTPSPAATPTAAPVVYPTILTGDQLSNVSVSLDELGKYQVNFTLKSDAAVKFRDYTTNNVGKYLAIVLDKKVVSAPSIQSVIPDGQGRITGSFTYQEANNLMITLRYGSLPVPFKVVESRVIGPTLGEDSLNKSLLAAAIGFAIVALFMLIFYRLPGLIAVLAITTFGLITFAVFKLVPVTLTLPGIAGFLLSTGGALDANILIFERLKEELRGGRPLNLAIDIGWRRAWSSIRDSNIATIITSLILLLFGSAFGATIVMGFAVTLLIGVIVSLFCAVFVTRTFLAVAVGLIQKPAEKLPWFGI
jgi:preprotein translocase subunit SecD